MRRRRANPDRQKAPSGCLRQHARRDERPRHEEAVKPELSLRHGPQLHREIDASRRPARSRAGSPGERRRHSRIPFADSSIRTSSMLSRARPRVPFPWHAMSSASSRTSSGFFGSGKNDSVDATLHGSADIGPRASRSIRHENFGHGFRRTIFISCFSPSARVPCIAAGPSTRDRAPSIRIAPHSA